MSDVLIAAIETFVTATESADSKHADTMVDIDIRIANAKSADLRRRVIAYAPLVAVAEAEGVTGSKLYGDVKAALELRGLKPYGAATYARYGQIVRLIERVGLKVSARDSASSISAAYILFDKGSKGARELISGVESADGHADMAALINEAMASYPRTTAPKVPAAPVPADDNDDDDDDTDASDIAHAADADALTLIEFCAEVSALTGRVSDANAAQLAKSLRAIATQLLAAEVEPADEFATV